MSKYKIKHTSIMHNGKLYSEGSEIELTENQAKRLSDFLEIVPEEKKKVDVKPETNVEEKTGTDNKTKKSTNKTAKEEKVETSKSDGGNE